MKTTQTAAISFGVLLLATVSAWAQNTSQAKQVPIPVKVTVVFKESQQGRAIDSLPYVLLVNASRREGRLTHLRMSLMVPFPVVPNSSTYRYYDVGTDIDCGVQALGDGEYNVSISAERRSVHGVHSGSKPSETRTNIAAPISSFSRLEESLVMRDAQTIQSLMATDPVTGRVLKVDVTLNVVK